jgi:hypothetical protein
MRESLPEPIAELVDTLATMPGAVAVVLGGSRALGAQDTKSDWDLGLYYRGELDLTRLSAFGVVHPPGAWGRIMNGGAWLQHKGEKVDVLLRDLTVVEHWLQQAQGGLYEVDALLGYLAGIPTYSLCGELAVCRCLKGELPEPPAFPTKLAEMGATRWRFHRGFSLSYARRFAQRGDTVGTVGHVAKATMELAHALACERRQWVLNEKHLLAAVGLEGVQVRFGHVPGAARSLEAWVEELTGILDATYPVF